MDNESTLSKTSAEQAAAAERTRSGCCYRPNVDILEEHDELLVLADMPGVPKDQLELKVQADTLSIEGRVVSPTPEGLEAVYAEVRIPRYRRTFTLSRELDASKVDASLKDGVLTLRIPKQAHAQPRRIEVQAG